MTNIFCFRIGRMLATGLTAAFLMMVFSAVATEPEVVQPFVAGDKFSINNEIDRIVYGELSKLSIKPAELCSDQVFIRRVYLDVIGTLPTPGEVVRFIKDKRPDKRAKLIDSLFERKEFADYWALKWCDLLRVKAEFPINLWPNAVQAYHRWIYDAIRNNMRYNKFVRELLTSSGSNFREPPVNFYRGIQGHSPAAIANAAALLFLGMRIDKWPADKRAGFEAFFSRVAYKGTAEWKEEIVYCDPSGTEPVKVVFPDGTTEMVPVSKDPRVVFANWLLSPDNPYLARNIVNRIWSWLLGRGLINEPDDIRPDNPPSNPRLLAYLEKELIKSDYDLRHIYKLILNSRTYQQSSIPSSDKPAAGTLFAYYPVRQLDAEVLIDALNSITGTSESYSSPIPEPFSFIPEQNRSINLADGSITSQFLEMFGRPSRDTGLESERNNMPNDAQRLHMLNSTHIQNKIARGWKINTLIRSSGRKPEKIVEQLYLNILSRYPAGFEVEIAKKYLSRKDVNLNQGVIDLAWVLINTKEFLFRH